MSKQHGWKTILYVNGGQVIVNADALRKLQGVAR
jgi:hypothetical protein